MEFENLVKLIETVSASGLTGFQYEEKGMKIKLSKDVSGGAQVVSATDAKEQSIQSAAVLKTQETQSISVTETEGISTQPEGKLIRSPLVGTFYAAPAEDADAFVAVGDMVKKGQTLAIVEAMKLMNEIESEFDGVIEEVLVENGQPVEYNQPLFRLK
ncbi:acetyl-CoA carboxylase biotin carboxyl carrier protein [Lachnospiraceae bacterium MD308]|nr:acetyl-CoA carboxylase biotin carboxyl carrier protein [Lachnospiraceae bacterium MD308]MCI8581176.1 acetyl-CoA carboxylase biotin carboxyl carrier protein [Dorea sp.]